jgi:alpha-tubulin suppressor-like RCC1 family protein
MVVAVMDVEAIVSWIAGRQSARGAALLGWLAACGDGSTVAGASSAVASAGGVPESIVLDAPSVLRDCNGEPDDGDEARLGTDGHCGGCNRACEEGEGCVAEVCLPLADIAMCDTHTCILDGGQVSCMGANEAGELGDGTDILRTRPGRVSGVDDAVQLAVRPRETCVRRRSGVVSCWGEKFGTGRPGEKRFVPTDVPELQGATDLALAEGVLCALVPGKGVVCIPPRGSKLITTLGPPPGPPIEDAVDIAATRDSLCAARRDGTVFCWDLTAVDDVPPAERMRAVAGVTGTLALVASPYTMCALRAGNLAACWGGGIVTTHGSIRDVMVGGLHDFGSVGAVTDLAFLGWPHDDDCATRVDGTAVCWPPPRIDLADRAKPRSVKAKTIDTPPALRVEATKVDEARCVLTREREVYCWGDTTLGRLGVGRPPEQLTPAPIEGVTGARDVVASDQRACARTARGLWCWGAGTLPHEVKVEGLDRLLSGLCASLRGQMNCYAGVLTDPLPSSGLRDVVQLAPAAQGSHLLSYSALHKDGTVSRVHWSREKGPWSLVQVGRLKGLEGVQELLIVDRHTCVREGDSGIRCFESLDTPSPGADKTISVTFTRSELPESFETVRITRVLDGGKTEGCGLKEGRVRCWDSRGKLEDVALDGITQFDISPHGLRCAIAEKKLFCWRGVFDSYSGHGTRENPKKPTEVPGLDGVEGFAFAQESYGERDAVFAWKGGKLWSWGDNGRSGNDNRTGVLGWVEPSRLEKPTRVAR